MGSINDRNSMDLTEVEDIKKRWQEYTEELHKKIFMTQITTMVWSLTSSQTSWTAKSSGPYKASLRTKLMEVERLMLKLKLQYFGHLMQRLTHLKRPWCWERLRAGRGQRMRWLDGIPDSMDREAWRVAVHGVAKSQTPLSDWTELELIILPKSIIFFSSF